MRTTVPVLVALPLLLHPAPRETATACPRLELRLAELVAGAGTIVLAEVVALHDVAGEPVAEVRVLEPLKGDASADTLFYPARSVGWDPEEEPKAGERAILLLRPDVDFAGPRAFWKAVDRLRAGRPFLDLAFPGIGRMRIESPGEGGAAVRLTTVLQLPVDVPVRPVEGADPDSGLQLVDSWSLVEAIRSLVERPEPVEDPRRPDGGGRD